MDFQGFIGVIASLVEYCFPFSLVFGLTAKLYRLVIDFMFNRKVEF